MKNRIIALALVIVMLFALSACGKKQEAASTPAPAETPAPTEAPTAAATPEPTLEPTPEPTPEPTSKAVEPDSGIHTFVSEANGISFDYDSKYVAMENPTGNAIIFAGTEEGIPYCTVSLMDVETVNDAVTYLNELSAGAVEELGDSIITPPSEPVTLIDGRDLYCIYYTYNDEQLGGMVICAYYAENIGDGKVIAYHSRALEPDINTVNSILQSAVNTFKMTK